VIILDNGSFHKAKKLKVPSNVRLVFLPPYGPELNPVERFWEEVKGQVTIDQVVFGGQASLADLRE
jgi:transposase